MMYLHIGLILSVVAYLDRAAQIDTNSEEATELLLQEDIGTKSLKYIIALDIRERLLGLLKGC